MLGLAKLPVQVTMGMAFKMGQHGRKGLQQAMSKLPTVETNAIVLRSIAIVQLTTLFS